MGMKKIHKGDEKKILIIDDDLDMRFFISTIVKRGGYTAFISKNGKEGIRAAMDIQPDLIILDVMMPEEGGAIMYRKLKKDPLLASIPVIILSAVSRYTFYHYLKMVNSQVAEKIPMPDKYVDKPPEPEDLLAIVRCLTADV